MIGVGSQLFKAEEESPVVAAVTRFATLLSFSGFHNCPPKKIDFELCFLQHS